MCLDSRWVKKATPAGVQHKESDLLMEDLAHLVNPKNWKMEGERITYVKMSQGPADVTSM